MPMSEYQAQWRKTPNGKAYVEDQNRQARAKRRAVARLIFEHQATYNRFFREELTKEP